MLRRILSALAAGIGAAVTEFQEFGAGPTIGTRPPGAHLEHVSITGILVKCGVCGARIERKMMGWRGAGGDVICNTCHSKFEEDITAAKRQNA